MSTAQEYFDSIDKEALAVGQLGKWATGKVGQTMRSGSKLKRLDDSFVVPPVLSKSPVGLKMKPTTPRPGLGTKLTWPKQPSAKFKPAGGSITPGNGHIRI